MGSGKTSVATILGDRLDAAVVSFGSTIRALAPQARSREQLQEAGSKILADRGPGGLVADALRTHSLEEADLPVVWEGLRHDAVLDVLNSIYGNNPHFLFFLAPDERSRKERMLAEAGGRDQLASWEDHETEGLGGLRDRADSVIHAGSPEAAAAEVISYLRRF